MDNDQFGNPPSQVPAPATSTVNQSSEVSMSPLIPSRNAGQVGAKDTELLLAEMQRLREDFDTKVKYDESKERLIDSLHRELQTYRDGLHFKVLRPVFMDLISMHDDLGRLVEDLISKAPNGLSRQMLRNLESFQENIEEILRRNGVEVFSIEGSAFVPNQQRALKIVDTTDPTQDKCIARRVHPGFEYEGRVLRPEIVEVYRTVSETRN